MVAEQTAELAYEEIGTGLPLVLLHAFPLNATMWHPQITALMSECRCIAPDLRGFGSSPTVGPYSMDQYADDVAGLLDYLQVDRAVVAGLSMGGYVALSLWRRHQSRVRGLVLADTRATADTPEGVERRRELIAVAREAGAAGVAEKQIQGLIGKTTREKHPQIGEDVAHRLSPFGCAPAGKDRHAAKEHSLGDIEKFLTPFEGGAK